MEMAVTQSLNPVNAPLHQESKHKPILIGIVVIALAVGFGAYLYVIAEQEPKQLGYWLNKA
jgi:hypothetical protein